MRSPIVLWFVRDERLGLCDADHTRAIAQRAANFHGGGQLAKQRFGRGVETSADNVEPQSMRATGTEDLTGSILAQYGLNTGSILAQNVPAGSELARTGDPDCPPLSIKVHDNDSPASEQPQCKTPLKNSGVDQDCPSLSTDGNEKREWMGIMSFNSCLRQKNKKYSAKIEVC